MSATTPVPKLDALLEFIRGSRGFDFTGYKRSSVERRVAKRMSAVGVQSYDEYLEYLQMQPGEFAELFDSLLINVTGFFRDPPTWDQLASTIAPQLVAAHPPTEPIRVWCAGCASGEEPYTVAMVLARVMGDADFRARVKIYATDIDEAALEQARSGAYRPRQVEDIPHDALERFFERSDERYVFRRDMRRNVIFGRHDLVRDAPISHLDLLVCRNTLMYFTAETQSRILRRFHFALGDAGVLLPGRFEMLITDDGLFAPMEPPGRAFRKVGRSTSWIARRAAGSDVGTGTGTGVGAGTDAAAAETLRAAAFDLSPDPQIVLDAGGSVVMVNAAARETFDLSNDAIGRPIEDLELYERPAELRPQLERVVRDARPIDLRSVPWRIGGRDAWLDLRIVPLRDDEAVRGMSIVYRDVTPLHRLQTDLTAAQGELDQAHRELRSTVEELETTNQELHSINEELETTNHELRSASQELATTNEELQSSRQELATIGDELREPQRSDDHVPEDLSPPA
jgi:two-component system CheB/CheR fusion protein